MCCNGSWKTDAANSSSRHCVWLFFCWRSCLYRMTTSIWWLKSVRNCVIFSTRCTTADVVLEMCSLGVFVVVYTDWRHGFGRWNRSRIVWLSQSEWTVVNRRLSARVWRPAICPQHGLLFVRTFSNFSAFAIYWLMLIVSQFCTVLLVMC